MTTETVWVYVIAKEGDAILSKVGISKHPEKRRAVLAQEHKAKMRLAHIEGPFTRAVAFGIERRAHKILALRRHYGEWFRCHAEGAASAVQCAARAVLP